MYNEELKAKFIEQCALSPSQARIYVGTFNFTEKYEEKWGADLCAVSAELLQPLVESVVGFRKSSNHSRLVTLKRYVRWCLDNNVPGACDDLFNTNEDGIEKIRMMSVASPTHLKQYLDLVFSPEELQTGDDVYRCYYWMAFTGISEEDALTVKVSDIDFRKMKIHCAKKSYDIPIEGLEAFHNCAESTQFRIIHPNYPDRTNYNNRAPGNLLLRSTGKSNTISKTIFKSAMSQKIKPKIDSGITDLRLSYYRVWISGIFYRRRCGEIIGIPPTFSEIAEILTEGKTYSLSASKNKQSAKKRWVANDLMHDYERWKLAYYNQ